MFVKGKHFFIYLYDNYEKTMLRNIKKPLEIRRPWRRITFSLAKKNHYLAFIRLALFGS